MLDFSNFKDLVGKYSECVEVFRLQKDWENEKAFQKLISLRTIIPKELYAMCLYKLFVTDTDEVLMDTLIEAFSGVDRKDIMFEEDLIKYFVFMFYGSLQGSALPATREHCGGGKMPGGMGACRPTACRTVTCRPPIKTGESTTPGALPLLMFKILLVLFL